MTWCAIVVCVLGFVVCGPVSASAGTTAAVVDSVPASSVPSVDPALRRAVRVGADGVEAATSPNWAGWVASGGSFSRVSATWVEPSASCPAGNDWAVFWVGLDGWGDNNVEQGGSMVRCFGNTPEYFLWWEMYPTNAIQQVQQVSAGDTISASVVYDPSAATYTITVTDKTTGAGFSQVEQCTGTCPRTSAEVVAEDPSSTTTNNSPLLPLADYGTIGFQNSAITNAAGTTGTFTSTAWQDIQVQESAAGHASATTSGLSPDGSSFSVTWNPTSPPGAVGGLQGSYSATSKQVVALSWSNPGGAVSGDVVRRSTVGGACPSTTSAGTAVGDSSVRTSQTDSGLSQGTYCYSVFAENGLGASPASSTSVTVTPASTKAPGAISAQITAPSSMSADASPTVPYAVSWTAGTCGTNTGYTLTESVNGGSPTTAFTGTKLSTAVSVLPGSQYLLAVSCGGPTVSTSFTIGGFQQTSATYTGTWSTSTFAGAWGGTAAFSAAKNASATFKCTCESIAWVTDEASNHGSAKVYIDGSLKKTVSTTSASPTNRVIVYKFGWAVDGPHTIKLVNVATSGKPRVSIDGFLTRS